MSGVATQFECRNRFVCLTHLLAWRPKCFLYGASRYSSELYFSSLLQWFASKMFCSPGNFSRTGGVIEGVGEAAAEVIAVTIGVVVAVSFGPLPPLRP